MRIDENRHEFEKWLAEKGIEKTAGIVPFLKEAWNKSLSLACIWFVEQEGTDYDAEVRYCAE